MTGFGKLLLLVACVAAGLGARELVPWQTSGALLHLRSTENVVVEHLEAKTDAGRPIAVDDRLPLPLPRGSHGFIGLSAVGATKKISVHARLRGAGAGSVVLACEVAVHARSCVTEIYVRHSTMDCTPCVAD
jgi:hypothetical protein